jgi:hypothetical protein
VQVVGLETTGVYWKSVVLALRKLSPSRLVWLVNPAEVKQVPGRKTDVKDSEWLSKLVLHGLVAPSYLPPSARTSAPHPPDAPRRDRAPGGRVHSARDRELRGGARRPHRQDARLVHRAQRQRAPMRAPNRVGAYMVQDAHAGPVR